MVEEEALAELGRDGPPADTSARVMLVALVCLCFLLWATSGGTRVSLKGVGLGPDCWEGAAAGCWDNCAESVSSAVANGTGQVCVRVKVYV